MTSYYFVTFTSKSVTLPPREHVANVVLTGPLAALGKVDGTTSQHLSVNETQGELGEPEDDQRDQDQAELFEQAVRADGRRDGGGIDG